MRLAYIMLVHRNPTQVLRAIRALDGPDTSFFVHVDRKAGPDLARAISSGAEGRDVRLLPRHVCHWGGFGFIAAALEGVREIVAARPRYDYGLLVTGQDYPLRPAQAIREFFAASDGKSYLDAVPLPSDRFGGRGGLDRLERMHWTVTIGRRRLYAPNRYFPITIRRRLPKGLMPYAGSGYWALSRTALEAIQEDLRRRPEITRFFRRVLFPDESFFQTVAMNSRARESVVTENVHYIDWSAGRPSPKVLTGEDLPALRGTPKLLARKFDADVDSAVLDRIDVELLGTRR